MSPSSMQQQVESQLLASYESLYRLAYTYVKNPDDAMDVVQESAFKAISRSADVRSPAAIRGWLCRIVVNTAMDVLRARSRQADAEHIPETGQEDVYQDTDLMQALDLLDERERTVIVLRFFQELKLQEIAQVTGENVNTVKTILYRTLKEALSVNQDRLDHLKQEYDAIPVPPELEERVRAAIRQARPAGEKPPRVLRLDRFLRRTGLSAAAAMLAVVLLANSGPGIAHAMEQVPVLGAITRVFTFRTYEEDRGNTSAHIDIPSVEGGGDALSAAIQAYTDTIIQQYQHEAALQGELGHYDLDLTYTVATDNETVFALRFDQTLVMASGNESVKIYAVDKATGELLTLSDLFRPDSDCLSVLTEEVQRQMAEQMASDDQIHYWLHDEDVGDLNFTALDPDASFCIDGEGRLVLVFDEGTVAPMYMGITEFTIPAQVVEDIALPQYLS